jgi:DNA-binding transcriptional ArsR family regulator
MPGAPRAMGRGASLALAFRALHRLQAGEWTISELGTHIGRGKRSAYRLLEVLEAQGLTVERRPDGREVLYRVAPEEISRWLLKGAKGTKVREPDVAKKQDGRRTCSVVGCRRPSLAHGRCHAHDMRWRHGWVVEGPIRKIRRLTAEKAAEVRRRYVARNAPTIHELAKDFGVARVTVWRVLHGWAHAREDGLQETIINRIRENAHR